MHAECLANSVKLEIKFYFSAKITNYWHNADIQDTTKMGSIAPAT
jgi:hypothetical protein